MSTGSASAFNIPPKPKNFRISSVGAAKRNSIAIRGIKESRKPRTENATIKEARNFPAFRISESSRSTFGIINEMHHGNSAALEAGSCDEFFKHTKVVVKKENMYWRERKGNHINRYYCKRKKNYYCDCNCRH